MQEYLHVRCVALKTPVKRHDSIDKKSACNLNTRDTLNTRDMQSIEDMNSVMT